MSSLVSLRRLQARCKNARRQPRSRQVGLQQVGDTLDRHISRREGIKHRWIARTTTLPREHGRVANVDRENNQVRGRHSKPPATPEALGNPVTDQRVYVNKEILVYWNSTPS